MSTHAARADFPAGVEWFTYTRPDGEEERDCQCARCGSSVYDEPCWTCGGAGTVPELDGWDDCAPETEVTCGVCAGRGALPFCISGYEWCEGNPLPGRENVRGCH